MSKLKRMTFKKKNYKKLSNPHVIKIQSQINRIQQYSQTTKKKTWNKPNPRHL